MQIVESFEHAVHDLLDALEAVVVGWVWTAVVCGIMNVESILNSEITNGISQIICHDEQIFFAHRLPPFILLLNILEVPVLQLDDVSAQLAFLNLIESRQFSLFISSVVKQFLDGNIPSMIK